MRYVGKVAFGGLMVLGMLAVLVIGVAKVLVFGLARVAP